MKIWELSFVFLNDIHGTSGYGCCGINALARDSLPSTEIGEIFGQG
jgi:hypothetical protein